MTEKEKQPYLEDLVRYQYADVAARLSKNPQDAQFATGALEKLISGFGVDKDILEGLKAGTYASEEGIKTAIGVYAGKYHKVLNNLTLPDFYNVRYGILKSLLGEEESNKAKEIFEKYKDQTVGSITKKFMQAQTILNDQTGLFDEKKKEEAKKTVEKLGHINNVIGLLEQRNYEELRNGATKATYKELISEALKNA